MVVLLIVVYVVEDIVVVVLQLQTLLVFRVDSIHVLMVLYLMSISGLDVIRLTFKML